MGTDSITLFNKALADRILAMDQRSLISFLEENIDACRHKRIVYNPVGFLMKQSEASVTEAVEKLLAEDYSLSQLKADVVRDFGFAGEEIPLDYWGCYAEVFAGDPDGSISSLSYLPGEKEETFVLLKPAHLTEMIESLEKHREDLRVMKEEQIRRLVDWRDLCLSNSDYMVAYLFDF